MTTKTAAATQTWMVRLTSTGTVGCQPRSSTAAVIWAENEWMRSRFTQLAGGDDRTGHLLHLLHEGAQVTASISGDPAVFSLACTASHQLLSGRP